MSDIETLQKRLENYMDRQGLRSTNQRRLVADVFFKADGHLSIEDVLLLVREKEKRIGYATVYRTLKLLKDSGVAYERHFGDGISRYEVAYEDEHHDHLICNDCGKIVEFENDQIERIQDNVARDRGFRITRHKLELYADCVRNDCPERTAAG
ncbi:MAG: transcriptional repressor [Myxococcales bacterium]|nr:transcriptional repressor [Myxococcales bacterium]